jgi:hypothetical protein
MLFRSRWALPYRWSSSIRYRIARTNRDLGNSTYARLGIERIARKAIDDVRAAVHVTLIADTSTLTLYAILDQREIGRVGVKHRLNVAVLRTADVEAVALVGWIRAGKQAAHKQSRRLAPHRELAGADLQDQAQLPALAQLPARATPAPH